MNKFIVVILVLALTSCTSVTEKQQNLIKDSSYGLILIKAANNGLSIVELVIENIKTGETTRLRGAIRDGNSGKPVMYRVKPGSYRLSSYDAYSNLNYDLSHVNYYFYVEEHKVNYVGDWEFEERWRDTKLAVNFSMKFNPNTVKKAKEFFTIVFEKWPLKDTK